MKITELTKEELVKKIAILVSAINASPEDRFMFDANWGEEGMDISIKQTKKDTGEPK